MSRYEGIFMRLRHKLAIIVVSVVAIFGGTAVSAEAASPTSVQSTQVANLATVTTVTKSCNTGGYWYMTDNVSVTRQAAAGGSIQYTYSRSANRTLTVNIDGTYHYVHHTATALVQYSTGSTYSKTYPPTSGSVYSQYGTDDIKITFHVYDNATMNVYKSCTVSF